jgi:hypothetical protein
MTRQVSGRTGNPMRATTTLTLCLLAGLAASATAAAGPAECVPPFVAGATSDAIGAKLGAESIALGAMNEYVAHASTALTNVTLGVPPSGPLNPDFPDAMATTTIAASDAAQQLADGIAQHQAESASAFAAC